MALARAASVLVQRMAANRRRIATQEPLTHVSQDRPKSPSTFSRRQLRFVVATLLSHSENAAANKTQISVGSNLLSCSRQQPPPYPGGCRAGCGESRRVQSWSWQQSRLRAATENSV